MLDATVAMLKQLIATELKGSCSATKLKLIYNQMQLESDATTLVKMMNFVSKTRNFVF